MQKLDAVINQENFAAIKTQIIELLGMKIDSRAMPISVPEEKTSKIKLKCLELYQGYHISILELKSPGPFNLHDSVSAPYFLYFQLQLNQSLKENWPYIENIVLNKESKQELLQCIQNLKIYMLGSILSQPPQVLLQSDASRTGWWTVLKRKSINGLWTCQKRNYFKISSSIKKILQSTFR